MKKLTLFSFALLLVFASCDLTDLNNNEKDPSNVPANPLFSTAQVAMGTYLVNGPKFMPQHWTTTSYTTVPQYEINEFDIPDNIWTTMYSDVLVNLDNARIKIEENELLNSGEKQNKLASIQVMKVLAYATLVDIFGNIPYAEALDSDNTQPVYDDAETIYMDLLSRLNTAIQNFDSSSEGYGEADIYYNGDIDKWIKFANSLKMRLGITIADVNQSEAQTAIQEASPNAFTSNADNTLIPFTSTPPNTNPLWEGLVQSGRNDNVPAEPLVGRMNNLNDPRRDVLFTKYEGEFEGGIYGQTNDYSAYSHFSELVATRDRPGMILGYDEVEFIRAEAVARGYDINGSAELHYEQAITADMEYLGVAQSDIDTYLSQQEVAYNSAPGTYKQKIGIQKWIALFLEGVQAWTEVRRLDSPDLQAPEGAIVDEYPSRFTYPLLAQVLNQDNYKSAASAIGGDNFTAKLFWDVK